MKWIEVILSFLRNGFSSKIDMNALVFSTPNVDITVALHEIDTIIQWNKDRKTWNERRLRAKMASAGESTVPHGGFSVGDFGLDEDEVLHLQAESEDEVDSDEETGHDKSGGPNNDLVEQERRRRAKKKGKETKDETSRRSEPVKPEVVELLKLVPKFVDELRGDLSKMVVTTDTIDTSIEESL